MRFTVNLGAMRAGSAGACSLRRWGLGIPLALSLLGGALPAAAQTRLTQEEALRLAFPAPARIERRTAYLDAAQQRAAERLAGRGIPVDQSVVTYYVGMRDGTPLGVAYFDVHRVRTLPEVLMIVVSPDARIDRIEVLRFSEPPEYRTPEGWLAQIEGRHLSPDLSLKGKIVNLTGATLTAQAVTRAARRVLALHQTIRPLSMSGTAR